MDPGGQNAQNEGLCIPCARELKIRPVTDMIEKMGLSDEDLEAVVLPGEKLEAPELLIQRLPSREEYSSSAMLHRYCNNIFVRIGNPFPCCTIPGWM